MNVSIKRKIDLGRFPMEVLFFGVFAAFWLMVLDVQIKRYNEVRETISSIESAGTPNSVKYEQFPVGNELRDRSIISTDRGTFVAQGIVPHRIDRQIEIQKRKSGDAFLCYNTKECYVMMSFAQ